MARRLAAILAADVVGYSRLMEADEAETLAALNSHRNDLTDPLVAEHDGRIVKLMGDGALVEFASVVDAVACAVAIQAGMAERNAHIPEERQIKFRIGVHLGDVMVEADDLYGDGVNVAARLEALAEPGGICLSQQAYDQIETKLDLEVEDLGPQQVKNIARPVHAYQVRVGERLPQRSKALAHPRRGSRQLVSSVIAVGLILAVGFVGWWWTLGSNRETDLDRARVLPASETASIVVLPFQNLSDNQEQDYFVDGFTEDLMTGLSKVSGLFVISRSTAFSYKGLSVPTSQLGDELGVRYVLEGSVRRDGERIRVNAQLIDTQSDRHLWADQYDRQLTDVFAVQDSVKQEIVDALALKLSMGEQSSLSSGPTDNLEAYEYYLRARKAMRDGEQRSLQLAYWAFEQAIELDPAFAEAYAGLAMTSAIDYAGGESWSDWARPPNATRAAVERMSRKALSLKPDIALAELAMGRLRLAEFRFDDALRHAERAATLEPGSSEVLNFHARALTALGRHTEAMLIIQQAFRRNPKPPADHYETLGMIQLALGEYDDANASLTRALELTTVSPNWKLRAFLAASFGFTGEPLNTQVPHYVTYGIPSIAAISLFPFYSLTGDQDRLLEGLRRARAPEFPGGFTPEHDAGRHLESAELETSLFGHTYSTWCPLHNMNGIIVLSRDGVMTWRTRHNISDAGAARARGAQLCATFPLLTRGREACFSIFESDADNPATGNYDFVMAGPELCYLSRDD